MASFRFAVVLSLFAASAFARNALDRNKRQVTSQCRGDVIVLIDGSDSINPRDFNTLKVNLQNVADRLDIRQGSVRFGAIVFSSHNTAIGDVIEPTSDAFSLRNQISALRQPRLGTDTAQGLERMNLMFQSIKQRGFPQVGIVMTDGESLDPSQTAYEANVIKNSDVKLISVAMGDDVTMSELKAIASSPQHMFSTNLFQLDQLETLINTDICPPNACFDDNQCGTYCQSGQQGYCNVGSNGLGSCQCRVGQCTTDSQCSNSCAGQSYCDLSSGLGVCSCRGQCLYDVQCSSSCSNGGQGYCDLSSGMGVCACRGECRYDNECSCFGGVAYCDLTSGFGVCSCRGQCRYDMDCPDTCAGRSQRKCDLSTGFGVCTCIGECQYDSQCTSNSCSGQRYCDLTSGYGVCSCRGECQYDSQCTTNSCGGQRYCDVSSGYGVCSCRGECQYDSQCTTNACSGQRYCDISSGYGVCSCRGECQYDNQCTTNACSGQRYCDISSGYGVCSCRGQCQYDSQCTTNACSGQRYCDVSSGFGVCSCRGECQYDSQCTTNSCSGQRYCDISSGYGVCSCRGECQYDSQCTTNACSGQRYCDISSGYGVCSCRGQCMYDSQCSNFCSGSQLRFCDLTSGFGVCSCRAQCTTSSQCNNICPVNSQRVCIGGTCSCTGITVTTPAPSLDLCSNCQIIGGVGYNTHPDTCSKFIQCVLGPDGLVIEAIIKDCPLGLWWNMGTLTCTRPENSPGCSNDPCAAANVGKKYWNGVSCRDFITCVNGNSQLQCCPDLTGFDGSGCSAQVPCTVDCISRIGPFPGVCDKRADINDPYKFFQLVDEHNNDWIARDCAPGTNYNATTCLCSDFAPIQPFTGTFTTPGVCAPELDIQFNGDIYDSSTHDWWVYAENVTVSNGAGIFTGNSKLVVTRFANLDYQRPIVIKIRYRSEGQVLNKQALVTNGDCLNKPSAAVVATPGGVEFLAEGERSNTQTFSMQANNGNWNEAVYIATNGRFEGRVNGAVQQRDMDGYIIKRPCALAIGNGFGYSGFVGAIDYVQIYLCMPDNL